MPFVPGGGTTVGDLVDRVFRDYLEQPDDRLLRLSLVDAIGASDSSLTLDISMLAADELDLLAVGALIEQDYEQMTVLDADHDTGVVAVQRGANGTTAVGHAAGGLVTIAPVFGRLTVADAVAENVVGLYPRLWRTVTEPLTSARGPVDISADAIEVVDFVYGAGDGTYAAGSAALLDRFPPSVTGKAVQFYGTPVGRGGYITYRARFPRPDLTDDLTALGVEREWERIVVVGAAAQSLPGREFSATAQEFISEQLQAEGYPPLTPVRQASALWQIRDRWLDEAARNLLADHPVRTVMNTLGGL